ncbi:FHA domain-containing protein [Pseudoalteromonas sp. SMS1]|uniref:FHA domain-containing protein n=1 Tax=Pseudoalteromonas sp. SMS1 TaxID=2908894 RepID=UPI001F271B02|nr:FHA domain-containing protein [Pseudoalteromonas sp. SMS1]MCF2858202.1 FHA domain-containing protein [Pseudoalteromonas sp. SMS1]
MASMVDALGGHVISIKKLHKVGRESSMVETVVNSPEVSRVHFTIEWVDNTWIFRDLSKNGTWINGIKAALEVPYELSVGDRICFAKNTDIGFKIKELQAPK